MILYVCESLHGLPRGIVCSLIAARLFLALGYRMETQQNTGCTCLCQGRSAVNHDVVVVTGGRRVCRVSSS